MIQNTRTICDFLNIAHPIIKAPMAGGPCTPELVSAVSACGGLGSIGAGYLSAKKLKEEIRKVKALTSKPFLVNVFIPVDPLPEFNLRNAVSDRLNLCMSELDIDAMDFDFDNFPNLDEQLDVVIEEGVPILSFTFGLLTKDQMLRLKQAKIKVIGTATCLKEAQLLEELGCDAIVLQGFEAGGHRGSFLDLNFAGIGLNSLLAQVRSNVKLPLIVAGGIMDGQGIKSALGMGASAVQMGTAFLTTKESGASNEWKQAILESTDTSTVLTKVFSGKLARGIKNKFITRFEECEKLVCPYPLMNEVTRTIRTKAKQIGNPDYQSLWAGQGSGMARDLSVRELMEVLVEEVK